MRTPLGAHLLLLWLYPAGLAAVSGLYSSDFTGRLDGCSAAVLSALNGPPDSAKPPPIVDSPAFSLAWPAGFREYRRLDAPPEAPGVTPADWRFGK